MARVFFAKSFGTAPPKSGCFFGQGQGHHHPVLRARLVVIFVGLFGGRETKSMMPRPGSVRVHVTLSITSLEPCSIPTSKQGFISRLEFFIILHSWMPAAGV
jgi:hypothetical protein